MKINQNLGTEIKDEYEIISTYLEPSKSINVLLADVSSHTLSKIASLNQWTFRGILGFLELSLRESSCTWDFASGSLGILECTSDNSLIVLARLNESSRVVVNFDFLNTF